MTTDDIKTALSKFGASLNEEGFITKGEKVLSVRPVVAGKRLRFESNGNLIASGKLSAEFIAQFVTRFWFWRPV